MGDEQVIPIHLYGILLYLSCALVTHSGHSLKYFEGEIFHGFMALSIFRIFEVGQWPTVISSTDTTTVHFLQKQFVHVCHFKVFCCTNYDPFSTRILSCVRVCSLIINCFSNHIGSITQTCYEFSCVLFS